MFNKKINVITGVNPVNYEYYFYFIKNLRETTSKDVDLNVRVITGPARGRGDLVLSDHQFNLIKDTGVNVIRGDHLPNVGNSLNYLMSIDDQKSNEFTLISDIDVALIRKDWDKEIIPLLEEYDVIGLPHEETKTFSLGSGPDNAHRPHGTPTIVWMIFKNNLLWKKLDFTHAKNEEHLINDIESKIYNIPANSYLAKDMGWRIPIFLKENGLKSYCLTNINKSSPLPRKIFAHIPDDMPWGDGTNKSGWPCDEGYHGEIPFLLHQKLSQRWQFKKSNISRIFYDTVDKYIESL